MQKISSYLYPNRVELLADLAGFITEYTNVYQRIIKIYKGVDNVIEFDIKNADQKRIELVTGPVFTNIRLNVMDAQGNALPNSPYTVTPHSTLKGIAIATIPSNDISAYSPQFFKYSVTVTKDTNNVVLYADSRFGAVGKIELVDTAMPATRLPKVYDKFTGEIDFAGNVMNRTSAIPTKFYETVPTSTMNFEISTVDFTGSIYLEGTTDSTISVNSFLNAEKIQTWTTTIPATTTVTFSDIAVEHFNYFRVTWTYPDYRIIGVYNSPTTQYGKISTVEVYYGEMAC
jgi:hypothetical protein